MLETDSPLDSPFTDGLLFNGVPASEVQFQKEAWDALQGRSRWSMFFRQRTFDHNIAQGLHMKYNGAIWQVLRIYDDNTGSFMAALAPHGLTKPGTFQTLNLLGSRYQTLGIAVPPRTPSMDGQPLQGLRFAVKDVYRLRGLKTSLCNAAYLDVSSPAEETATIVQNTLDAGARVVGMTKLSSMIGKEELRKAVDYHVPFNPSGDGYRSPACRVLTTGLTSR